MADDSHASRLAAQLRQFADDEELDDDLRERAANCADEIEGGES